MIFIFCHQILVLLTSVASRVNKVGWNRSCNSTEITGAQNFDFASKFPQNGGFQLFCIFVRWFSDQKFSTIFWQPKI